MVKEGMRMITRKKGAHFNNKNFFIKSFLLPIKRGRTSLSVHLLQHFKTTSNNSKFVTPAPYHVRGKLRRESSDVKSLWIPASAGMTFLEVALINKNPTYFLDLV